jgi:hypothetical protein
MRRADAFLKLLGGSPKKKEGVRKIEITEKGANAIYGLWRD